MPTRQDSLENARLYLDTLIGDHEDKGARARTGRDVAAAAYWGRVDGS